MGVIEDVEDYCWWLLEKSRSLKKVVNYTREMEVKEVESGKEN